MQRLGLFSHFFLLFHILPTYVEKGEVPPEGVYFRRCFQISRQKARHIYLDQIEWLITGMD